jgi:NAD(P)-dependent dehydrogenase (short-subunit alcohol dehydrogenase family)
MGNLTGRIAIVTGASRRMGIGSAICLVLAKEGADIFLPIGELMTDQWNGARIRTGQRN